MARNAHFRECAMMHRIGADDIMPNAEEIDAEIGKLLMEKYGIRGVQSDEEFKALVDKYGMPPKMQEAVS